MAENLELTLEQQAEAMQQLMLMPGWKILVKVIQEETINPALRALESGTHENLAQVESLQYKVSVAKTLMALPQAIIDGAKEDVIVENQADQTASDPYHTSAEDILRDDSHHEEKKI